ncbi:MAG: DNA translocase FtsK [Dehalococcoidia bacterium]|nr:DNA translocase FtsK [Dehalococcoidia bacterium]
MARSRDRYVADPVGFNLVDFAFRPEVIGTTLVVGGLAAVPFLLPIADLVADLRDSVVRALGVHAFTATLFLAIAGITLAARRVHWLHVRPRMAAGALAMLIFSAGVLATWSPEVRIGRVDLRLVSAGGSLGDWLMSWPGVLPWLSSFFLGFALLWPETAAEIARTAPAAAAHGSAVAVGWLWAAVLVPSFAGARESFGRLRGRNEEWPEEDWDDEEGYDPEDGEYGEYDDSDYEEGDFEDYEGGDEDDDEEEGDWQQDDAPIQRPVLVKPRPVRAVLAPAPLAPVRPHQTSMDLDQPRVLGRSTDGWQLPPVTLLEDVKAASKAKQADTQRRAALIVDTLASFGVDSRVVEINEGPTVTQFGVEPGWDVRTRMVQERDVNGLVFDEEGQPVMREVEVSRTRIRVQRITSLQNDLALALAAPALRIEAPVPGKPVVGIEVPNTSSTTVTMKQLMSGNAYEKFAAKADLPVALGAGVSGEPIMADLAKMPHLLIAGATGAGKSVCLNAIITGLLMHFSPNELRLVLIDPKRVEMTPYAEIPHLAFSQIVVDMDRVVGTLQAVINEMESRYRRFAQSGVKNLKTYNELARKTGGMQLPFWVVVVDELADLMLAAPYQVETQIVRLAQLARATGIHLVIATQRPSVDVVTGLIKANFPTRIAFAMSSQVDSRTVLDQAGAEKLLGRGDMLFVPPDAQKPVRVQGVYLSDKEIESVVGFWTNDRFADLVPEKHDDLLAEAEEAVAEEAEAKSADPLIKDALELARESKTISISMLQRRLKVGYPRAARIMDALEERGVVAPAEEGSTSSREVLHEEDGVIEAGDAAGYEDYDDLEEYAEDQGSFASRLAVYEGHDGEAERWRAAQDAANLAAARAESRYGRDDFDEDGDGDEESRDQGERPRRKGPSSGGGGRRRRLY